MAENKESIDEIRNVIIPHIEKYLNGELDVEDFTLQFINQYKRSNIFANEAYTRQIKGTIFSDCDEYTPHYSPERQYAINEEMLRERCKNNLKELKKIVSENE